MTIQELCDSIIFLNFKTSLEYKVSLYYLSPPQIVIVTQGVQKPICEPLPTLPLSGNKLFVKQRDFQKKHWTHLDFQKKHWTH